MRESGLRRSASDSALKLNDMSSTSGAESKNYVDVLQHAAKLDKQKEPEHAASSSTPIEIHKGFVQESDNVYFTTPDAANLRFRNLNDVSHTPHDRPFETLNPRQLEELEDGLKDSKREARTLQETVLNMARDLHDSAREVVALRDTLQEMRELVKGLVASRSMTAEISHEVKEAVKGAVQAEFTNERDRPRTWKEWYNSSWNSHVSTVSMLSIGLTAAGFVYTYRPSWIPHP